MSNVYFISDLHLGHKRLLEFRNSVHGTSCFVMSHVPMHPQELEYRNWPYNVHGHIHHKDRCLNNKKYLCVSVDTMGFIPTSLDEIHDRMRNVGINIDEVPDTTKTIDS